MNNKPILSHPSVFLMIAGLSLVTLIVTILSESFGVGFLSASFIKTLGKTLCLCIAAIALDLVWGYLGQKLGEWSTESGSNATQKKVYLGKGEHYYEKAQVGQFKMDAYDMNIGDTILITGPTTGAKEMVLQEMFVNDEPAEKASKGDEVTIKLDFKVRRSDKLYKIVKTEFAKV